MKFKRIHFIAIVISIVFSMSCSKESGNSFDKVELGEFIQITATTPNKKELIDTKAHLDAQEGANVYVKWDNNDQISVFDNATSVSHCFNLTNGNNEVLGEFSGSVTSGNKPAAALYPYSDKATYDGSTLTNLVLPNKYETGDRVVIPMFAFADDAPENTDFPFKALGGFIHFSLKNIPADVVKQAKYLKFCVLDENANLTGKYKINNLSKACDTGNFGLTGFTCEKTSTSRDNEVVAALKNENGEVFVDIPVIGENYKFSEFILILQDANHKDIPSTFMRHITKSGKDAHSINIASGKYLTVPINFKYVNPIDLTTHDCEGKSLYKTTTANCYVVNQPGRYRISLVYGNALKGDNPNLPEKKERKNFVNYLGNEISSPLILTDTEVKSPNCTLVWEDVENLVTNVRYVHDPKPDKDYLEFIVPDDKVEGNAIVAVRDADNKIMWSWHIWVTKYKLGEGDITEMDSKGNTVSFMSVNLGWCDGNGGRNTYYQWGRKDPMLPSKGINSGDQNSEQFGPFQWQTAKPSGEWMTFVETIKNPNVFYKTQYWNDFVYDLWNYGKSSGSLNTVVRKTIYDPCPVGYHVSGYDEFNALLNKTNTYFKKSGYRSYVSGDLGGVNSSIALWSACAYGTGSLLYVTYYWAFDSDSNFTVNKTKIFGNAYSIRPVKDIAE